MAYTTINKSTDYFNTKLYTGNSTDNHAITGVGFDPDFTWIKSRTQASYDHMLFDALRGTGSLRENLRSNTTSASDADASNVKTLDSDGFTLGTGGYVNHASTFVSWNWKANGAGSSNTDGSITSTVSANTTSGFSIVKWNGQTGTVGHGLGAKPAFIVVKCLGIPNSWVGTHQGLGTNMSDNYIILNSTGASGSTNWGGEPTSSVFSINSNVAENNDNIAYCFAEKQGFSKFGSYTGNGNADGSFIYTGFAPAFIITKITSGVDSWFMYDNKRSPFNVRGKYLVADGTGNNSNADAYDFLSNGFKVKSTATSFNGNGSTYIYMAFAEAPLVGSNNVSATAR